MRYYHRFSGDETDVGRGSILDTDTDRTIVATTRDTVNAAVDRLPVQPSLIGVEPSAGGAAVRSESAIRSPSKQRLSGSTRAEQAHQSTSWTSEEQP